MTVKPVMYKNVLKSKPEIPPFFFFLVAHYSIKYSMKIAENSITDKHNALHDV